MFQTLLEAVRSSLANAIFRIQFVAQPYPRPRAARGRGPPRRRCAVI